MKLTEFIYSAGRQRQQLQFEEQLRIESSVFLGNDFNDAASDDGDGESNNDLRRSSCWANISNKQKICGVDDGNTFFTL